MPRIAIDDVVFGFLTIVFAISVVAVPMMLDRGTDPIGAIVTSVRSLLTNPLPMAIRAITILVVIGASLVLGFVPLLLTGSLIGHATWHAYRATVER